MGDAVEGEVWIGDAGHWEVPEGMESSGLDIRKRPIHARGFTMTIIADEIPCQGHLGRDHGILQSLFQIGPSRKTVTHLVMTWMKSPSKNDEWVRQRRLASDRLLSGADMKRVVAAGNLEE